MMAPPLGYPGDPERDLTLRDGSVVRIRPIRPDDAPGLRTLHSRLGSESAYQRFFTIVRRLPPDWARALANVDYQRRVALVVEAGADLIGVGRYEPTNDGLGTILFDAILQAATARSFRRFRAYVLADNRRMLDLISRFTRIDSRKTERGVTELVFRLDPARALAAT